MLVANYVVATKVTRRQTTEDENSSALTMLA